jgi:hypothetical protein
MNLDEYDVFYDIHEMHDMKLLSLDFSLFLPLDFSLLNEMENYKLEHL